jgi:hypothetical protein
MKLTETQERVLSCLRPAEEEAMHVDEVASRTGLTERGARAVLYRLVDRDLVAVDEFGYYRWVTPRPEGPDGEIGDAATWETEFGYYLTPAGEAARPYGGSRTAASER